MRFTTAARAAIVATTVALGGVAGSVAAHDEIESSVPAHGSQFDEPISEVTITFDEPVGNVEVALVGPDDRDRPGTVTKVSDTTVRLEFDLLTDEGEYLVRYLAEEDGHLNAGAITFVYGSRAGSGAGATTWILFGIAAALILAVGLFFTLRRAGRPDSETEDEPEPIPT